MPRKSFGNEAAEDFESSLKIALSTKVVPLYARYDQGAKGILQLLL
jgi:hypothetical protein